jgi:hypothetical protein
MMLGLLICGVAGMTQTSTKRLRLLTVGNSFADNATAYLRQIAQAAGYELVLCRANIGGCSLEQHWKLAEAYEADPAAATGKPYAHPVKGQPNISLREALALESWDFVTIQQYSVLCTDVATYRPYAGKLAAYIKQYAPQAEVLLHQTWAYRNDDPRFTDGKENADSMYRGLVQAYSAIARELGVRQIPVGDAFHLVTTHPRFTYTPDTAFDFAHAVYPAVPNQTHSLHAGWRWGKDAAGQYQLSMDGHHANKTGEYLGGLVFFERLTGVSALGNSFVPPGISTTDARILQEIAQQVVQAVK